MKIRNIIVLLSALLSGSVYAVDDETLIVTKEEKPQIVIPLDDNIIKTIQTKLRKFNDLNENIIDGSILETLNMNGYDGSRKEEAKSILLNKNREDAKKSIEAGEINKSPKKSVTYKILSALQPGDALLKEYENLEYTGKNDAINNIVTNVIKKMRGIDDVTNEIINKEIDEILNGIYKDEAITKEEAREALLNEIVRKAHAIIPDLETLTKPIETSATYKILKALSPNDLLIRRMKKPQSEMAEQSSEEIKNIVSRIVDNVINKFNSDVRRMNRANTLNKEPFSEEIIQEAIDNALKQNYSLEQQEKLQGQNIKSALVNSIEERIKKIIEDIEDEESDSTIGPEHNMRVLTLYKILSGLKPSSEFLKASII